ncbi:MAG: DUF4340 domain-containing protein [Acidobacteriia bacterium]|nr:DUF4340 domain-containing protein [Terriglobia bacterium]
MKKKYLNTLLALALLAAVYAGFTYWDKRKASETKSPASTTQEKLFAVESSHVQSFTIKPRGGEAVNCQRQGSSWAILEPQKLPADSSAISSLLSSLSEATIDQVVEQKPANLKDFGLDSPAVTLDVTTDTKPQSFELRLGDETPTSGGVYAQVAGNPRVLTLASYVKSAFDKKLFDLRDKRAATIPAGQLQRLEVQAKAKHFTLVKNPEGVWDLVLPPAVRADRFEVEGMVSRLEGLTMQSMAAEDKKNTGKYGLGAPELTLKLSGAGNTQTITLGKKEGERYYAVNSALDPVFTLDSSVVTEFEKDPSDLRAKDLFTFSTFEVKRLEAETPSGSRTFERQPQNKWKQTAPTMKDVPTDKVEALLGKLRDLRAESFPKGEKLEEFGLAKPSYRFKAQFGDKNETETVELGKVGEHVYARREHDALASEVSKSAFDDIEKALKEL